LSADCSTVGLYFVTITWQRIFTCSLQVTVVLVGVLNAGIAGRLIVLIAYSSIIL